MVTVDVNGILNFCYEIFKCYVQVAVVMLVMFIVMSFLLPGRDGKKVRLSDDVQKSEGANSVGCMVLLLLVCVLFLLGVRYGF